MTLVVDGLNGSRIDQSYLDAVRPKGEDQLVLHVTVNNLRSVVPEPSLEDAFVDLALWRRFIKKHSEAAVVLTSRQHWEPETLKGGRVGLILGYQNSSFVGPSFEILELLYDLDVRVMQLTHNGPNPYGSGCAVEPDSGLTELGREFISRCNSLGIVLDFAHTGDRTTAEAAALSQHPVLASHTNAKAVTPHARNKSDDAIRAVAENGGVIGLCFFPPILSADPKPAVSDIVDHFQHLHSIAGEDGVAFGSDFITNQDHGARYDALRQQKSMYDMDNLHYPLEGIEQMDRVGQALRRVGFSQRVVEKFLGENLRRVFCEVMRDV